MINTRVHPALVDFRDRFNGAYPSLGHILSTIEKVIPGITYQVGTTVLSVCCAELAGNGPEFFSGLIIGVYRIREAKVMNLAPLKLLQCFFPKFRQL